LRCVAVGRETAAPPAFSGTHCPSGTDAGFKPGFEKLVLDHPNIGLQVIKNLSRRIDWLTSRVGSLSLNNLEDRLYHVLSQVAREHGIQKTKGYSIQFPLTHEELGFLVGAHRVSVTRAIKSLKETGRIIQEGRALIVPHPLPQ
jgi:CRP-like cAMP-binding protein